MIHQGYVPEGYHYVPNSEAEKTLSVLKGTRLVRIFRIVGIVVLSFSGKTPKKQYELHIQCPFRIVSDHRVLVGSGDLYISKDDPENGVVSLIEENVSLMDQNIEANRDLLMNTVVEDVSVVNAIGDVRICLNDAEIHIFTTENDGEAFRFLDDDPQAPHLIKSRTFLI